jgi:hypothetical protein
LDQLCLLWEMEMTLKDILLCIVLSVFLTPVTICAQTFSSGSTGADGALDLSTASCSQSIFGCQLQVPESGIFNFTTVNIPVGATLSFIPNLRNTAVVILAQGTVMVRGTIQISGGRDYVHQTLMTTAAGPGGFAGAKPGHNGFGPGGGNTADIRGRWVGPLSLVPIIGGSGAMGFSNLSGGGGGGAITMASSTSITLPIEGQILALGDTSTNTATGAGGAIRLVANSINVGGSLQAHAFSDGHPGMIRLEAPAGSLSFTGSANPIPIISTTINPQIVASNTTPTLAITSVGGFPVGYTAGRPDVVDLILPNQLADPINVVVQASNVPVGTEVNLNISGLSNGTFTPGVLLGTSASSFATVAVSGLNRAGPTYIIAIADFSLPADMAKANPTGPNQIAKVRVIAKPNANSKLVFMRRDGTEIDLPSVPKTIQQQFGLN